MSDTLLYMSSTTLSEKPKVVVQGFSLRRDQLAFIEAIAEAERHGNRSRVLQAVIDQYQDVMTGRKVLMTPDEVARMRGQA